MLEHGHQPQLASASCLEHALLSHAECWPDLGWLSWHSMAGHCAISLSGSTLIVHMLAQEFKVLGAIPDPLRFCQPSGRLCPDSLSSWEVLNCRLSSGETQASEVSCQEE